MTAARGSGGGVGVVPIDAPDESGAIALASGSVGDTVPAERWFALNGQATVRNVAAATLTPVLPKGEPTGSGVIVAPGGGYLIESMENEGWAQARWLAERGVAAFVLKYRLQPTPADDAAFTAALVERFAAAAAAARAEEAAAQLATPAFMIDDAAAAMRLVRARAASWGVDPQRVGYLGFSAGAMIGLALAERGDDGAVPAFLGAIYPSMAARTMRENAPALFAALAADDPLYGRQGFGLIQSWLASGASAELHLYARGGHGFGMGTPGTTTTALMPSFHLWLERQGWLAAADRRSA